MRHFLVTYQFRPGLNGAWKMRETTVSFDDIDPETTDADLKRMAENEVDQKFLNSSDYPQYGKFWRVLTVEEINY